MQKTIVSVLVSLLLYPLGAAAGVICRPVENSRTEVECADVGYVLERIEDYERSEEQPRGPKIRAEDIAYALNDMSVAYGVGPGQVLVIDVENSNRVYPREVVINGHPGKDPVRTYQLTEPLPGRLPRPDVSPPINGRPPVERPIGRLPGNLPPPYCQQFDSEPYPEIHEGINTDGQMLYGPPGSDGFLCSGWPTIDSCKNCCMGTRTALIAGLVKTATWCHAWANACTIAAWVCHAGCALAEAAALAAILYSWDKCNGNCEHVFWNDTSVDWSNVSHQALHWDDDTVECEGWVLAGKVAELNGAEHISIPGIKLAKRDDPQRHSTFRGTCVISERTDNTVEYEIKYGMPAARLPQTYIRAMGIQVPCPPAEHESYRVNGHVTTEGSHDGIVCIEALDYRMVDIDPDQGENQIPYVNYVVVQGNDEAFYFDLGDGTRLYLDGLPTGQEALWRKDNWAYDWFPDRQWKIWVYGNRSGNRVSVSRHKILTPFF